MKFAIIYIIYEVKVRHKIFRKFLAFGVSTGRNHLCKLSIFDPIKIVYDHKLLCSQTRLQAIIKYKIKRHKNAN